MKKIAIFASGSGTNMQNIAAHFETHPDIQVSLVVCNKVGAGVIQHAKAFNIPVVMISRDALYNTSDLITLLKNMHIDLLVLAGFLWLIPANLIAAFPNKIINIHPALLPKFGGKGMYGSKVHQAVIDAGEKRSGITIHYVNEKYDEGAVIFQAGLDVAAEETADSLASKIHALEYAHYPVMIEQLLGK